MSLPVYRDCRHHACLMGAIAIAGLERCDTGIAARSGWATRQWITGGMIHRTRPIHSLGRQCVYWAQSGARSLRRISAQRLTYHRGKGGCDTGSGWILTKVCGWSGTLNGFGPISLGKSSQFTDLIRRWKPALDFPPMRIQPGAFACAVDQANPDPGRVGETVDVHPRACHAFAMHCGCACACAHHDH